MCMHFKSVKLLSEIRVQRFAVVFEMLMLRKSTVASYSSTYENDVNYSD